MISANEGQHEHSTLDPQVSNGDISAPIRNWIKWWVAASIVFVSIPVAWLVSDREPTAKELTFAYRQHIVAVQGSKSPKEIAYINQRLNEITLHKKECERLAEGRYRCRTEVRQNNRTLPDTHDAAEAIYSRDTKAWQFLALNIGSRSTDSDTGPSESDAKSPQGY